MIMHALKKIFVHSPWSYIGAVVLAVAVGLFRYFALPEGLNAAFVRSECLSVSGVVTFLVGMLLMVGYFGAFDLFGYVFSPGRTGSVRKYRNYTDYTEKMVEKRSRGNLYFVPFFVVGALVVLLSVLLG